MKFYFIFSRRRTKRSQETSILALPSYPESWPGGLERFANWKPYFEKGGVLFTLHWPCSRSEFIAVVDRELDFKKWVFHLRVLRRRFTILKTIRQYQAVYIQREAIPLYDSRYDGVDRVIMDSHANVIYDFYDADYTSTPLVTNTIFSHAKKITVASRYLESRITPHCPNVFFTRLCLPIPKLTKRNFNQDKIRIGWMGSPGNARNLIELDKVFSTVQKNYPQVEFTFVCRQPPDLSFQYVIWHDMNAISFDYNGWLQTLDIGIVPYMDLSERTRAKTAMKSLEFWANSIALVCSPFGMSDKIENGTNCLVANSETEWGTCIQKLINNRDLKENIASKGYDTFLKFHTYTQNYNDLKEFLLQPHYKSR